MNACRAYVVGVASAVLAAGAGCGASRPPSELVDARSAYARAASAGAARFAPDALEDARSTLVVAERKQADDAGSDQAKDLAYVAHRKALVAEAETRSAIAGIRAAQAVQAITAVKRSQLADAENRIERGEDKAALESRPARERAAKEALDRLDPFAAVSHAGNAMTVSLADSVLFEGDTAELMPTARERLDRVAQAMHEVRARSVVVNGYMDRSGDPRRALDLSRRRADAVRAYLVSRGVAPERVRAVGRGDVEPLSSNASPEGRSDNRRVEIVVESAGAEGVKP